VREFHPDWFHEEREVEQDHVHLHMELPPKYAVSTVEETLKSVPSRRPKEKFPHVLSKVYWDGGGGWARGFFAATVGIHEPFRVGIDRQGIEHHLPDSRLRPPSESLMNPRPSPIHKGQRAPGCADATYPHHGLNKASIIVRATYIAGFAGERIFDPFPLILS